MPPAIRAHQVGKCYRLHSTTQGPSYRNDSYRTIRESLMDLAAIPVRALRGRSRPKAEEFWALRDVDLEIRQGDIVGLVGCNGAGKSTLLKIISRITRPTTGRLEIYGRVGSLLEVATGFHPELTGRENIYLNGAILGMSRREIARKFDEIVAFAGIERFLDTPVKRYSSGMYVRLAFAVAAHMEPEILLVDEVLAVGDINFQKKCLGKMGEVSRSGRTILFVSHNLAAIESLCTRCVLLDHGRVVVDGDPETVLTRYHAIGLDQSEARRDLRGHRGRLRGFLPLMTEVVLEDEDQEPSSRFRMGARLSVKVRFDLGDRSFSPVMGIVVKTNMGAALFGAINRVMPGFVFEPCRGTGEITCHVDRLPLMPGLYYLDLALGDEHRDLDIIHDAISFEVAEADVFGSGKLMPHGAGPIFWPATWSLNAVESEAGVPAASA